ncbi:glycoside hydrolase family 88 protein [Gilvimarinus sp. SDUM040013]|uniref:Glycoside hydrolase family 88 protein n=1 Tax=Gilvimarinus gilvus TaxID=3058038 RepID=A0ABU4RXZ9_9GAMM|nr:glycoside hydrolase family 88 protein [Gilvimarinus sp. SDUM040013]MDO3386225.1 glycoside hydrolase family 88 protein [Gilvimarinus sp. SDUM040013]MDX6849780.1 glycoside hydrolase family 88 protein [Gilvimarinus sp. SDUM040013]
MHRKNALVIGLAISTFAVVGCKESSTPQPASSANETTVSAASQSPVAEITLSNPLESVRSDTPYYVSFNELGVTSPDNLGITVAGSPIASQMIDRDGDGDDDGLFTLLDFDAAETLTLHVKTGIESTEATKRTQAEISHKMGGSWQEDPKKPGKQIYVGGTFENVDSLTPPAQHDDHSYYIRYEGPGIESDKVGYRIYLDRRNGFDIFGKTKPAMALQNVGQDGFESYHHMADWGMDILKVGSSLGAGGYGYWDGEKVVRVQDVEGWDARILDNGNLYSAFSIDYKNWKVADKNVNLNAVLSMHGGSRMVHTRLTLDNSLDNFAIGLVKHEGTEFIQGDVDITGKAYTYVASWGKQTLNDDHLGMALLFRKSDRIEQTSDDHNYVSVMKAAGEDLDYYFLAAWEAEANGITSKEAFVEYLKGEVDKLTLPPREQLKTKLSESEKTFPVTAEQALNWSKRLADDELERKALGYHVDGWDVNRERDPKFEYDIIGLLPLAYDELNKVAPDERYAQVIPQVTGSFVNDKGDIARYKISNYNIDSIKPGRNLLTLFERTGKEKYKIAAATLREQLEHHPKTSEGAFWHKKKYDSQLWLDGVYMGMPFLAGYSVMFEDGASLDEVVKEFELTRKYLRDADTGLYYHAWDEKKQQDWADAQTGLSPHFWARGMGWLAMAVVDVLEIIPQENTEQRAPLLAMVEEMAADLKRYQDPQTGVWWQIMNMPEAAGNYRESSASAMFSYFYAKAINNGYLSADYTGTAQQAYDGLIREFVTVNADGSISMTNQCYVAGLGFGRDGSYEYYMSEPVFKNDPKGTGPFILAGIETYKLLK